MSDIEKLKKQLESFELEPRIEEIGEVAEVKDGTLRIYGLGNVENFELIEFEGKDTRALVLDLKEYEVGAVLLAKNIEIKEGDIAKRTKRILSLAVGEELLGRIIDPLGNPLDGRGEIKTKDFSPIERVGPSVIEREPVSSPLHTGILAIDALTPIGRGQRELILGDRGIGKTALVIDTILNQKEEENRPVCVYVACGKKKTDIKRLIKTLEDQGAMDYTIFVCAFSDDPASFLFLAPFSGATIGEYFRDKGRDALVVFDDLTKQAWAWREISLVLRRPPGREAYPGDIFYLHSRLLERAAKLSKERGGGSLTALPIAATQAGDISGYIPTNIISICDGQIYLDSPLFYKGQRPAIDIGKSVSRVGSRAQLSAMKKITGPLKLDLAQFQELERFSQFTEELDPQTKKIIERGKRMREILKQEDLKPLPFEKEVVIICAGIKGFLDNLEIEKIQDFKKDLVEELEREKPKVLKNIRESRDLDEKTESELDTFLKEFTSRYGT